MLFMKNVRATRWKRGIYKKLRSQLLSNYDNAAGNKKRISKENSRTQEHRLRSRRVVLDTAPFTAGEPDFNFCKLIAGSEGTLAFITEITLECSAAAAKRSRPALRSFQYH